MGNTSYYFKSLKLLLLLCTVPIMDIFAQNITVKGIVEDKTGEGVIGASVVEKGTTNGMITDFDGNFELSVPPNATLTISFVGYQTQDIEVNGRTSLSIVLQEDTKILDEVVVIGYGTAKRSDVTGSISSVNESTLKQVPTSNVASSMQGRIAGVQIQQTSTRPGQSSQIRIRGSRSLTASNDPLIVVDGIPFGGSLNDIASDDIKSVDILKDASATAIYGSRGANGVILITTNRGHHTEASVSYSGYAGFGTVSKKYPTYDRDEYLLMKEQSGASAWPLLDSEQAGLTAGTNTNWQDLMYQTAIIQNHNVNVSGGSDNVSASLGIGYYSESAVLPNQDYTRYSVRAALDFKPTTWLKFGLNSQNAFGITNGEDASYMSDMILTSPLVSPYNEDGTINTQPHYPREDNYNVLLVNDTGTWTQERQRFNTLNPFMRKSSSLLG